MYATCNDPGCDSTTFHLDIDLLSKDRPGVAIAATIVCTECDYEYDITDL